MWERHLHEVEEPARHGHRISPPTLYPALHGMVEAGLLTSERQVVDGRMGRVWRHREGRRELAAAKETLAELTDPASSVRPHTVTSHTLDNR